MNYKGAGFGFWDWLVLIGYFVGCTAFGLWVSRKVRTSGRLFPRRAQASLVDHDRPVLRHRHPRREPGGVRPGPPSTLGFATIWYQWKNMLITPFYWLMAPWYRRSERTTMARSSSDRYGPALALVYTLLPSLSSRSTRG